MKSKENKRRRILQRIGLAGLLWATTVSVPTILEVAKPTINYPIVSFDGMPRIKEWKKLKPTIEYTTAGYIVFWATVGLGLPTAYLIRGFINNSEWNKKPEGLERRYT